MTSFDIAVLLLCIVFLVRGVWTGFVSQIAVICGLVLGFIAAGRFHSQFYEQVIPFVSVPQLAFFITYGLLFLGVYVTVIGVGIALKKVMKITMLSGFDRVVGGVFGLSKAVFVASLLFITLAGTLSNSGAFLRRSYTYPFLANTSQYILTFIKDKKLRSRFLPKEPAISSLFSLDKSLPFDRDNSKLSRNQEVALEELRSNLAREYAQQKAR